MSIYGTSIPEVVFRAIVSSTKPDPNNPDTSKLEKAVKRAEDVRKSLNECVRDFDEAGAQNPEQKNLNNKPEEEPPIHETVNALVGNKNALMFAAEKGWSAGVKFLLQKINVRAVNDTRQTALHFAAMGGNVQCCEVFFTAAPTFLRLQDFSKAGSNVPNKTPLMHAAELGHAAVVEFFCTKLQNEHPLDKKQNGKEDKQIPIATINLVDENGKSALLLAAENQHFAVIQHLLAAKADPCIVVPNELTPQRNAVYPLTLAVRSLADEKEQQAVINSLWHAMRGNDPNAAGLVAQLSVENSPLMKELFEIAVRNCRPLIAEQLIKINPHLIKRMHLYRNQYKESLLFEVLFATKANPEKRLDTLRLLINQCNFDVTVVSSRPEYEGHTVLITAVRSGDVNAVKFLIRNAKVDINQQDNRGRTALVHAVIHGHLNVVNILLETCAIDRVDAGGNTVFHNSQQVEKSNREIRIALISAAFKSKKLDLLEQTNNAKQKVIFYEKLKRTIDEEIKNEQKLRNDLRQKSNTNQSKNKTSASTLKEAKFDSNSLFKQWALYTIQNTEDSDEAVKQKVFFKFVFRGLYLYHQRQSEIYLTHVFCAFQYGLSLFKGGLYGMLNDPVKTNFLDKIFALATVKDVLDQFRLFITELHKDDQALFKQLDLAGIDFNDLRLGDLKKEITNSTPSLGVTIVNSIAGYADNYSTLTSSTAVRQQTATAQLPARGVAGDGTSVASPRVRRLSLDGSGNF